MKLAFMLLAALPLCAQAKYMALDASAKNCPRVDENELDQLRSASKLTRGNTGTSTRATVPGAPSVADSVGSLGTSKENSAMGFIPKAARKDASKFSIYDAKGKPLSVADAKGKVVIVNFWQTACEPSTNQLIEMADFQPKGEKFGFLTWPVNMDPERWQRAKPFMDKNKKFFEKTQIFMPGLGEQGPAVFMEVFPSLPALFILDREGKIAFQSTSYEPNALGQALQRILLEK